MPSLCVLICPLCVVIVASCEEINFDFEFNVVWAVVNKGLGMC